LRKTPQKTVAIRADLFDSNMHQIVCRLGLCPRHHWGSLQRSPDLLALFWGLLLRERREREGQGRGGTGGRGREERGAEGRGGPEREGKGREKEGPHDPLAWAPDVLIQPWVA